ncbi:DsbA family protein [Escherichia coli]
MVMIKKIYVLFFLFCVSSFSMAIELSPGKNFIHLKETVADAPKVVEFFSFYCPPCYGFAGQLKINKKIINILPPNTKIEKYHVSSMGSMGRALTEAWSVAKVLGVESKVELPLFEAVQLKKTIKSYEDIQKVFLDAGVSSEDYNNAKKSFLVKTLTAKQEEMVRNFGVTSTPSYYVYGKYLILNSGIKSESNDGYGSDFAEIVYRLLQKKESL